MLRWVSTIAQATANARQRATTPTSLTIRRSASHIVSLPFPLREDYQHARRGQTEWATVSASATKVGKIARAVAGHVTLRRLTRERYPFSPVDRVARKNSWRKHFRMTAAGLSPEPQRALSSAERAPLLRWLIFTGATAFAAILLWRYGLLRLMVSSDRTYLSSAIALIYIGASLHCLWRTIVISREGDAGQRGGEPNRTGAADVTASDPTAALPQGLIADHIHNLALKARTQGRGRLDQTLLLRSLADRLRGSNGFGAFASDTVMKLGLLGNHHRLHHHARADRGPRCER